MNSLKKIFWILSLILFTACPLPDVSKYAQLTLQMNESIKKSSNEVVGFLSEALSNETIDENKLDPEIKRNLNRISGVNPDEVGKSIDYLKILNKSLKNIHHTLDAFVAYSDALVGIKDSGNKGKESFNLLANSLNDLLSVPGIAPISETSIAVGKYLYGAIANVRAANKLEEVIFNADTVIQYVSVQLNSLLFNLEIINNVAKSQYLNNTVHSKNSQQINKLYWSLNEKEARTRKKIILLNYYENGDFESLLYFLYEDVPSLYKLQNDELSDEMNKIYSTEGLSPHDRINRIKEIVSESYQEQIKQEIIAPDIYTKLNITKRRVQIQNELAFIRNELKITKPEFEILQQKQKQIEKNYNSNKKMLEAARKGNKSWAKYHRNMLNFLESKHTPCFNELQLYINEINELQKELVELKK